jgi:small GTP-binding protein
MTDLIKIIIIGESSVGKSNIMMRYTTGEFSSDMASTIGVEFFTKKVIVNNKDITVQVWDTAGQERFKSITRSIYHGAKAVIIVYDITNMESFNSIESWILEAKNHACPNAPICLVGNKNDLEHLRVVPGNKAANLAKENELLFFETSAANNKNISFVFDGLIKKVIENNIDTRPRNSEIKRPEFLTINNNVDLKNTTNNVKQEKKKESKCKCS